VNDDTKTRGWRLVLTWLTIIVCSWLVAIAIGYGLIGLLLWAI
jgi:hypothetical protein